MDLSARNATAHLPAGRVIVDHVTARFGAGQLAALVGPNGAGKSTLCSLLAGDRMPSAGDVSIAGVRTDRWRRRDLARRRSVLPQASHPAGWFRAGDIVLMGRTPWVDQAGRHGDDDRRAAEQAMADVGAAHLAERSYPTLSGGEQARVQLARVLAQGTPILLLDEPTANLDLRYQHLAVGIARRRADAGAVVIVVLHDLALAAAYADRVLVMSDGRLVADGPPADVLTGDRLSDIYGHPVVDARHPTQGWHLPLAARADASTSLFQPTCPLSKGHP